ncbi:MAG: hypothetical protein GY863_00040 [bacterium]|nr:hypothetical protein [bacterium]
MQCIIGLDGGGSKTIGFAVDEKGNLLSLARTGPSNINSIGLSPVRENILQLIDILISDGKIRKDDIKRITGGFAGAGSVQNNNDLRNIFSDADYPEVSVHTDIEIAIEGALLAGEGIVVNSGTGSFAAGKGIEGNILRNGGYGYLLGDEGSGFNIGLKAIGYSLKTRDGIFPPTILTELICRTFGIVSIDEVIPQVYNKNFDNRMAADLTPGVIKAAKEGDEIAQLILKETADHFMILVRNLLQRIEFSEKPVKTCLIGSVFKDNDTVVDTISNELSGEIRFVPAEFPPVIGAVFYTMKTLNISISDEICDNLNKAVKDLERV